MKVLVLTHVFPRFSDDTAAPFLLVWARGLQAAGMRVEVVAPHEAGLPRRHQVGGVDVRLVRYAPARSERLAYRGRMHELVRSPSGPPLLGALVSALAHRMRALERVERPDVVHVHWWLPGAVVARLARLRVPVVVTVHGTDVALLEGRPALTRLARWALAGADRVEAVSADLGDRLHRATGRPADAIGPMPLATPPVPAAWREHAHVAVLAAGRLVADKGFHDLVEAVARLDRPARLEIAGDGPEAGALADRARTLGVDLALPGALSPAALARRYAAADVVVLPSRREGLGLVAAEALAAGAAVIATDSGGTRDLLPADALVPPADVPALAHAIRAVAADPAAARARAAVAATALRSRLSPEAVAERTLAGYQAVVARPLTRG